MMKNISCKEDFGMLLRYAIQFWDCKHIKPLFSTYSQGIYLYDLLNKFQDFMWIELETTLMD